MQCSTAIHGTARGRNSRSGCGTKCRPGLHPPIKSCKKVRFERWPSRESGGIKVTESVVAVELAQQLSQYNVIGLRIPRSGTETQEELTVNVCY